MKNDERNEKEKREMCYKKSVSEREQDEAGSKKIVNPVKFLAVYSITIHLLLKLLKFELSYSIIQKPLSCH